MHALLIDGENIPAKYAEQLRVLVPEPEGFARVYGNVENIGGWTDQRWVCMVTTHVAKNAADIALAVNAMRMARDGGIKRFVIASNDGGLAYLVRQLRDIGCTVSVAGTGQAALELKSAAEGFHRLSPMAATALPAPTPATLPPPTPTVTLKGLTKLDRFVFDLVGKAGTQGLRLVEINPEVLRGPGTKIATLPEKTWRKWFTARPQLFALDPQGPNARVRLAPGA